MMKLSEKEVSVHTLFRFTLFCKWVFAIGETLAGVLFIFISHSFVTKFIFDFLQEQIREDSFEFIASHLLTLGASISVNSKLFIVLYLISHGVIKICLLYGLSKKKLIAYPLSALAFGLFLAYQLYHFHFTPSFWLLSLSVLDVGFILLILYEYKIMKTSKMFSQIDG